MIYVPENFNAKEKNTCLMALIYVLNLSSPKQKAKKEYMALQMKALNIPEDKYDEKQQIYKKEEIINSLKKLNDIRVQRYIIREMIMLAVADQDIGDNEIRDIYQIAEAVGVDGEKVGDFFIWAAKGIEWQLEGNQLVEEDL